MNKYLRKFNSKEEYKEYLQGEGYGSDPQVSIINDKVKYLKINYADKYLTFEALEDTTFSLTIQENSVDVIYIAYSLDNGENWIIIENPNTESSRWLETTTIITPEVQSGCCVMWKAQITYLYPFSNYDLYPCVFSSNGKFNISGNILSLHYGDDFRGNLHKTVPGQYPFAGLFKSSLVVSAANLALYDSSPRGLFNSLFRQCPYLVEGPLLPQTVLNEMSYYQMFGACPNLSIVKAPFFNRGFTTYWCMLGFLSNTSAYVDKPIIYLNKALLEDENWVNDYKRIKIPAKWAIVYVDPEEENFL